MSPTHLLKTQSTTSLVAHSVPKEIDHLKKTVSLPGRCRRRHCLGRCHHFISWAANDTAGAARSLADPSGLSQVSGGGGGGCERRRRPGGGVDRTEPTKILLLPFLVLVPKSNNTTVLATLNHCYQDSSNPVSKGLHSPVRDQDLSLFPSLPPCQPVAGCTCPNHRPSRSLAAAVRASASVLGPFDGDGDGAT